VGQVGNLRPIVNRPPSITYKCRRHLRLAAMRAKLPTCGRLLIGLSPHPTYFQQVALGFGPCSRLLRHARHLAQETFPKGPAPAHVNALELSRDRPPRCSLQLGGGAHFDGALRRQTSKAGTVCVNRVSMGVCGGAAGNRYPIATRHFARLTGRSGVTRLDSSFGPQSFYRIDRRGAARRNEASQKR